MGDYDIGIEQYQWAFLSAKQQVALVLDELRRMKRDNAMLLARIQALEDKQEDAKRTFSRAR